jgi:hypothetical protein
VSHVDRPPLVVDYIEVDDDAKPSLELYRRRDHVDALVPVDSTSA